MGFSEVLRVSLLGGLLALCAPVVSIAGDVLRPSDLNKFSKKYDGERIVVSGYLAIGPERRKLYASRKKYDIMRNRDPGTPGPIPHDENCLSIANPDFFMYTERKYAYHNVVISGRFIAKFMDDDSIRLGECWNDTAIVVEEVVNVY
jgi:hypothetical protein